MREVEGFDVLARFFRLLAHPVRLQILNELRKGEACVCHLQAITGRPQAYVSQQLGFLKEGGLVQDRREGPFVYYSLTDERVNLVLDSLLGEVRERVLPEGCSCPICSESRAVAGGQ